MASKYLLLDTNILSESQKPRPAPAIVQWLKTIPPDHIAIPFSAIFEIAYGIRTLLPDAIGKAVRYEAWLEQLLAFDFQIPESNAAVARNLANIASSKQLRHFWIPAPDLPATKPSKLRFGSDPFIAATAIAHQIPIVTSNVRDFLQIDRFFPLPGLYDPCSGEWLIDPPDDWSFPVQFGRRRAVMVANCG